MNREDRKTNHEGRSRLYKTNGLNNEELRKKRRENEVQIRKQKRMEIFENRRKLSAVTPPTETTNHRIPQGLIDQLKNGNSDICASAVRQIGQKLSNGTFKVVDLSSCGILYILADIVCNKNMQSDVINKSIAEIFQICANRQSSSKSIDNICIESLCTIFNDNDDLISVKCDAIQGISVYAGVNAVFRNITIDMAIVPALLSAYEIPDDRLKRCVMWLVSQLFHKLQEYSPAVEEVTPLLEIVANGMTSSDSAIQSDAIRACALMAEWQLIWDEMQKYRLITLLVESLSSGIGIARPSVLRAIDFITQTTNHFTEEMLNSGLLDVLKPLINIRYLSRDVCFILSNISAEGEYVVDKLISSNVLKEVTKVMESAEYSTRKEAAYILCHSCSSTSRAHIAYLLEIGFLSAFTDLLTCMDPSLVSYILDAIEFLLQYGEINLSPDYTNPVSVQLEEIGCRQKLEFLTQSQNIDIHIKSYAILERFFDDDEIVQYNTCAADIRTSVDQAIDSLLSTVMTE